MTLANILSSTLNPSKTDISKFISNINLLSLLNLSVEICRYVWFWTCFTNVFYRYDHQNYSPWLAEYSFAYIKKGSCFDVWIQLVNLYNAKKKLLLMRLDNTINVLLDYTKKVWINMILINHWIHIVCKPLSYQNVYLIYHHNYNRNLKVKRKTISIVIENF